MKPKKVLLLLGGGFLLFGAVMNIVNALNNYGMATNSLHSEMWAQLNGDPGDDGGDQPGNGDNTGGSGTTTGGNNGPTPPPDPNIRKGAYMEITPGTIEITADSVGKVIYKNQPVGGTYIPYVTYKVNTERHHCELDLCGNVCDTRKEGIFATSVGGAVTGGTGTGTGGGNTPTVPTFP